MLLMNKSEVEGGISNYDELRLFSKKQKNISGWNVD